MAKKMDKTTNDLQNTTQKTEDRATRNPLKTGGAPEGWAVLAPPMVPIVLLKLQTR
jgi:hypothetical protein